MELGEGEWTADGIGKKLKEEFVDKCYHNHLIRDEGHRGAKAFKERSNFCEVRE